METRTQKAKGFVGKTVRFTSKPRPFGPTYTYEGVVVKVKGLNADGSEIHFEDGRKTYYNWGVSATILS